METTTLISATQDTPNTVPPSFMGYLEEETGLGWIYLVTLACLYVVLVIALLVMGVYGIYRRVTSTRKLSRKKPKRIIPEYQAVRPIADLWTDNFDENYMSEM